MKKNFPKIKWKKLIIGLVILAVVVAAGVIGYRKIVAFRKSKTASANKIETASVTKRNIEKVLSSSGTIQPLNTYNVKTLVSGEIISADFEVGDTVKKGQVLYKISTDDIDNKIDTAETSVSRAKESYYKAKKSYSEAVSNYNEAKEDYNKALSKYGDKNIKAEETGIIKTLYLKKGNEIQKNAQVAQIYNNSYMKINVPFSANKVNSSLIGKTAELTMEDTNETVRGTVTAVSNIEEVLNGNRVVKQVTIKVKNPGGLTTAATATATIGSLDGSASGTFSVLTDTTMTSDKSGEIGAVLVKEGSKVTKGEIIAVISQDSIDSQLETYKKAVENAKDAVDNASDNVEKAKETIDDSKSSLAETIDSKTDYRIKAPISGKIISKTSLKGDTINANNSNSTAMCVIYDLSAVTFEMDIDELDIKNVKVGQEVEITADALENQTMSGKVTNISLESTTSQGVTQYPVTVKVDKVGDLLPGMNVTGKIILNKVTNVIAIPSDALMRGDQVYVKDASVTEKRGNVPAGFKAVSVTTGLTDGDYVEVKSGLKGNEIVYVVRTSTATSQNMPQFNMGGMNGRNSYRSSNRSGGYSGGFSGGPGGMQ